MLKLVSVILLALCLHPANAQCLKSLDAVFMAEAATPESRLGIKRTYILCPNTRFEPGVVNQKTGQIEGGQTPLVLLQNAHVKCGNNGKSSNKCVIDGTGTYAMFLAPYNLFELPGAANIVVQGITMDFFVRAGQLPVIVSAAFGDVTFLDCIFSNNQVQSIFYIDMIIFSKRRLQELEDSRADPDFKPNFNYFTGNVSEIDLRDEDVQGGGRFLFDGNGDSMDSMSALAAVEGNATAGERRLQVADFRVTFQGCSFEYNSPVRNTMQQGGLSVIRFRARNDPLLPENQFQEYVATMDARFIRSTFIGNIYSFTGDQAVYRSMIDFYSGGQLTLRQNCFEDSPVKAFGVVTVNQRATIVNDRNWLDKVQPALRCPFLVKLGDKYVVQACAGAAAAPACRANTPTRAPSQAPAARPTGGGFGCFPGDTHCDVEGQGSVLLQDIKLGDKVLVDGNKYEPVYSFGHKNAKAETEYIRIITTGPPLDITKDHMLFVNGRPSPAENVKIGDKLVLADGGSVRVKSMRYVRKRGAYAPFTPSGTIIVNDMKASSFVGFQGSPTLKIAGYDTGVSFQFCALAFEAPHRLWCKYISSCSTEEYTEEGVSTWVAWAHNLSLWFLSRHPVVMFILSVPIISVFTFLTYPVASLLTVGAIALVAARPDRFFQFKTVA